MLEPDKYLFPEILPETVYGRVQGVGGCSVREGAVCGRVQCVGGCRVWEGAGCGRVQVAYIKQCIFSWLVVS